MKIAITADVHLSTYKETPERYHALEDILRQSISENVDALFACGIPRSLLQSGAVAPPGSML
jgi:hypothetical protein